MTDLHTYRCQCRQCRLHREIEPLESLGYSALPRIEDMDSLAQRPTIRQGWSLIMPRFLLIDHSGL